MYNKLLISAGGGIDSHSHKVPARNSATIAIGLGGTGIDCLERLKKDVIDRVKPDNVINGEPIFHNVKFLAIDTDDYRFHGCENTPVINQHTEFVNLYCPDVPAPLAFLSHSPKFRWVNPSITDCIINARVGAGGVRQIGRLLFMRNVDSFVDKLTNMIHSAVNLLAPPADINIDIFTGLCGGTGSGIFLDVCYIARHVIENMGLTAQAHINGYFFMPDVNISNAPYSTEYLRINGFAAMKELDYTMNFANNGGKWDQDYESFHITSTNPPVYLAHLISTTDIDGALRENGYQYAIDTAADFVAGRIIQPLPLHTHIVPPTDIRSGACYNYRIIGSARSYIPYKDILTYLASATFKKISKLQNNLPVNADIEEFVSSNGLRYENFVYAITRGVNFIPNYDINPKELQEQILKTNANIVPHLLRYMQDAVPSVIASISQNCTELLSQSSDNSIISRVESALIEISADADKGPYYAGSILHNLGSIDILNVIEGYIKQSDQNIRQCRMNMELREIDWQKNFREFQSANLFNRKKTCADYVNAVHAFFMEKVRLEQYELLKDLFIKLQNQLNDLYENYFSRLKKIITDLCEVFDDNFYKLSMPERPCNNRVKIVSAYDIRHLLDSHIETLSMPDVIRGFVPNLIRNKNRLCEYVSDFFSDLFCDFANKTVCDYLKLKFPINTPAELENAICHEAMAPLTDLSRPIFCCDSTAYSPSFDFISTLSVPAASNEIQNAATFYTSFFTGVGMHPFSPESGISLYKVSYFGMPLFAYKGVSTYKSDYDNHVSTKVGLHIYEGSQGDTRDYRKLINVTPISAIPTEELTEKEKDLIELYEKALEKGIISKTFVGTDFEYRLNIFDKITFDSLKMQAEQILSEENADAAANFYAVISTQNLDLADSIVIRNNGLAGYEDVVVRDNVLGSQVYVKIIKEQLEMIYEWNELLARLKP